MSGVLPLFSSLVALAFALAVFDQYLDRRRPYQLVWSFGLLAYFMSTGAEFYTATWGVSGPAYRLWYMFGAVFTAAYLGMGTLYLLLPRRAAHIIFALLTIGSLLAIYKVAAAPLSLGELTPGATLSGAAFPRGWAGPRLLTPFFNSFGTLALVGGAVYSALAFYRRRAMPWRVTSNILIAVGAMLPAMGGSMARLGSPQYLYASELLGIVVIFAGFLRSREVFGVYRVPFVGRKA